VNNNKERAAGFVVRAPDGSVGVSETVAAIAAELDRQDGLVKSVLEQNADLLAIVQAEQDALELFSQTRQPIRYPVGRAEAVAAALNKGMPLPTPNLNPLARGVAEVALSTFQRIAAIFAAVKAKGKP